MPSVLDQPVLNAAELDQVEARVAPACRRIAFLLSRYPAISHTFFLAEVLGLRARGLELEVASINPPDRPIDQLPPREANEAAQTFYVKTGRWPRLLASVLLVTIAHPLVALRGLTAAFRIPHLTLRRRLLWLFYLAEAMLVGRWMRKRNLHHLHVHFGGPVASVAMLTSKAWGIPFSMTIHGPEELLDSSANQLREKILAASFVLCISDFCRSQLFQLTPPLHWKRFSVHRLGVDPDTLRPVTRMPSSPESPLHLVCTGRLAPQKGYGTLLEALDILRKRGLPVRATLVGDGPERTALEAFCRDHHLTEQVHFAGATNHITALDHVRTADLFVLASFGEGIPVALMEAMALGVPVVSTFVAGIPELIRDGRDGLLVPPGNALALADALQSLIQNPDLRRRLAGEARLHIESVYNLTRNHDRLAAFWREQLTPPEPAR